MSKLLEYWPYPIDVDMLCYTPTEFREKKKMIGTVQTAMKEAKKIL